MLATGMPMSYATIFFGLKELTCYEAMNLVSSAFPQHSHIIFLKLGQKWHLLIVDAVDRS